jgi:lysophospholipase L1-like esterase
MPEVDPSPFLRGNPYPALDDAPYPRVPAADRSRLPGATWHAAMVPAGVRLELDGDARAVRIRYTTSTGDTGFRGDGGGRAFEAWTAGAGRVGAVAVVVGSGVAEIELGSRPGATTVHLPEVMRPTIHALEAIGGELVPGPRRPRWVAYGDSILEGWASSAPALCWSARVARTLGLDLVNLGYAGAARGEIPSAQAVAALPADVVTLSYGTNCWSTIPHSDAMVAAGLDAFLAIVRAHRPDTPVVVVSPIRRPAAELAVNELGATLQSLRAAMEGVVRSRVGGGDTQLVLVPGEPLVADDLLADGVHPGDQGHRVLAGSIGEVVAALLLDGRATPSEGQGRARLDGATDPTGAPR